MVAAILEHRQEDFMLIIFIQKFCSCQGLFPSQSPKLQSDLLKVLYKSEQKKITHVHEINSAVFNLKILFFFNSKNVDFYISVFQSH